MTVFPRAQSCRHRSWRALLVVLGVVSCVSLPRSSAAADQIYFPAIDNTIDKIVARINAETVRLDISAWYLTEHSISIAIANRFNAGVKVRLIGDRGSIFEIDPNTKNEFYWLANQGVPIRLRFNPTWYPEIDHWKMALFVGQNIVEFGSANWDTYELAPWSSTNFDDETVMFSDDPDIVNAFRTKFDRMWNDTTAEPESVNGGPPYLKDWYDACANEPMGCDFKTVYPNAKPMVVNTARLEPDYPMPADLIWGQGPDFNNRLIHEINNEPTSLQFVMYRLTVPEITQTLLNRFAAGVQMQMIIEPDQYLNRKWPEFWLSHAYWDSLWAAGVPMKQRLHQGMTHMKTLVTGAYATNASSNLAAAWQRDHDYFVSSATKLTIYTAIKNRVTAMWNDTTNFGPFVPQPPDASTLATPASGATGVSTAASLVWNIATFATNYDVYLGFSSSALTRVGNVPAQLNNNPPSTYSWTPPAAFCTGTTYYWRIVSRTNATPRNSSLVAASPTGSFTTAGANNGCSGLPGSGGGGGTPPPSNVPAPWATQDIGAVGAAGTASYANGTFSVSGAGADMWDSTDAFRYVYQALNGDGQIVARVVNEQNTNTYAKAGLELRSALTAGSAHALLDVKPDGSIEFMVRTANGGQTTYVAGGSQAFPAWLKLTRSSSTITAYASSDGNSWRTIGTTTLSIAASANIGLAVNSHTTAATNTATFDNVSVTGGAPPPPPPPPPSGVPSPWTDQDVGSVGTPGNASFANNVFTVKGAGADIWDTADGFHYVLQSFNGDGQIVGRVTAMDNTNSYAKAGLMIRQTTSGASAHVLLDIRPDGNIEFMTRSVTGGATTYVAGATKSFPVWLKLARSVNTVTGYVSNDGSTWTALASTTTSMPSSVLAGMIVNSHDPQTLNTSTFDNVAVTAGTAPPPPPPPPSTPNIVIYAGDVPSTGRHGSWSLVTDSSAAGGSKLITLDSGVANTDSALASPVDYFDVTFNANAGTPYTLWFRLQATANAKANDSIWVQFSDATAGGGQAYALNSTSGLLVNLATDGSGASLNHWGWQNSAYWLSQATTITFATSGSHTLRVQVREDGVQLDQIVLSPGTYLSSPPGSASNDSTIVPKS